MKDPVLLFSVGLVEEFVLLKRVIGDGMVNVGNLQRTVGLSAVDDRAALI